MSGRVRNALLALGVLLSALALAACGDLDSGEAGGGRGELTQGTTTTAARPSRDLPPRPQGVAEIEGQIDGSLTEEVVRRFPAHAERTGLAVRVESAETDEDRGFEALCAGETDIVAASRRITQAELDACAANGLEVIDFQVAFDAIVIVTRNERDVGADCVNLAQLRSMFGATSPVTSWNQLNPNFLPLRLTTAGPTPETSDFDFFGARVLGVPDPTLANFRSDYNAFPLERQVKNFVAGRIGASEFRQAGRAARSAERRVEAARENLRAANRELRDASRDLDAAGRRLDRAVARGAAGSQEQLEQAHDAAKARHKLAEQQQKTASRKLERLSETADRAGEQARRLDRAVPPGAVGIIGFSYYELFEEKLRPLEIDGQTGDRCVFPSDETISSELYPLERTLRLYTTQRSLRRAEVQEYIRFHLEAAKAIATSLELIPLPDQLRDTELAKIEEPQATTAATEQEGAGAALGDGAGQQADGVGGDGATTAPPEGGTATEPDATTTEPDGDGG